MLAIGILAGAAPAAETGDPEPDQAIRYYQQLLRRNPVDARGHYRLADAYVQKARASGDMTFFTLAEQALGAALAIDPEYGAARRHLAFVLYTRHDFAAAAREAARAIEANHRDGHAFGILGDAYLEIGRYDEAATAYAEMLRLGVDLFALARRAGLRSVSGDTEGAIADLRRAIEEGRARGRPRESVAWVQWQLGNEHFALGDLAAAEAEYEAALWTLPTYHRATAGLAQVRAARGDYPAAVALYQKALGVVPMPEYAAALGDVQARLGGAGEAAKLYALVEYIGRLSALNRVLYNRELAYFYADHDTKLPAALALARRELEVRQDVYAYDLYAWALYKNGLAAEAVAPMTRALSRGTRDAKLHYHAGLIYRAVNEAARAREHLRAALALNPHFHLLHGAEARRALVALEGDAP